MGAGISGRSLKLNVLKDVGRGAGSFNTACSGILGGGRERILKYIKGAGIPKYNVFKADVDLDPLTNAFKDPEGGVVQ